MFSRFRSARGGVISPLKRAGPTAVLTAAIALILVPSASSGTYVDKTGDNATAADIAGVEVSADKSNGQITFGINGSNLSKTESTPTLLLIDSDANPQTGHPNLDGADYLFGVDSTGYAFLHWTGADWQEAAHVSVRVLSWADGALTISVNRSELGNSAGFNFWVRSIDTANGNEDDAPDDGAFNYSIDADGPDIQSLELQTIPATGPRAGKKFVVTPGALKLPPDGATLTTVRVPESYRCTGKLGTRSLRGTGTGGCTFSIPKKKSKGKQLKVAVTVIYQGATKTFTFAFKVR